MGVCSVVDHFPSMDKAMDSISTSTNKNTFIFYEYFVH